MITPEELVSHKPLNGVALLPSVATTSTTDAEGSFEFSGVLNGEHRVSASHPGWKTATQTVAISLNGGPNEFGPIELKLEPCDAEYEGFLREIVTAGWNSINSAQQNHKLAKQRKPEDVRADYALAIAAIRHKNLELAFSSLASVLRKRSPDPLWDRALEAYLWIDLERGNAKTLKNLFAGNRQIYGQDRNYASLDTARLMGTVTGMLLGPWNEEPVGDDGEPLAKQLESKLSPAHAVEMKAGQEAVLQKFRPGYDKLVGDSRAANRQQQQMDAQRARLNRELEQAKAALANKQAEVDQACRLAEQKSAPWKESRQINEKELALKQQQQKTKQQQLRNLPAASPNRSDLEADILALGLEINELKKATVQLTTRIDTESASCTKAQQAFTAFSNQQNAIVSQLTDQINELGKGTDPPDPEIPAELEKLDTYYTYPLEPRRAEFLQGLGCGEEVPNAPRGAANPQLLLERKPADPASNPPPEQEKVLTIVNNSGRAVSVFYLDEQQQKDVLSAARLEPGQRLARAMTLANVWTAKVDGKLASYFMTPQQPSATWNIGPLLKFVTWSGDDGQRFQRDGNSVWCQYDPQGRLVGQLVEEERTDEWVAIYSHDRPMWVRLYELEAIYDSPNSNGWQTLAKRAGG